MSNNGDLDQASDTETEESNEAIQNPVEVQQPQQSQETSQPPSIPRAAQTPQWAKMADAYQYVPRTKVDWCSNTAYNQFRLWQKEVERIINGPMHDASDAVKLNTVYIWAGAYAESLIEARQAEDPLLKVETVDVLLKTLGGCLTHETYFREAREDFYNVKQKADENTTAYYSRIMDLYKLAEFPANSEFLIVDKLIHGCVTTECKRKLMGKSKDVNVKTCLDVLRQYESVSTTMKHLSAVEVSAAYTQDPTKRSQKNGSRQRRSQPQSSSPPNTTPTHSAQKTHCMFCGGDKHRREQCPARDAKCDFCRKKGHFQRSCFLKKKASAHSQNAIIDESDSEGHEDSYQEVYDMAYVSIKGIHSKSREVLSEVRFEKTARTITGKVDTGAMMTCIPITLLREIGFKRSELKANNVRLRGVTGADMKACGRLEVQVTCNNITGPVEVIATELGSEFILGIDFCRQFQLISVSSSCIQREITVKAVHITEESAVDYHTLKQKWKKHLPLGKNTGDPLQDVKNIFPEMFDGTVGLFDGQVDLKLTHDAKPVQLPPRSVALSQLPKLKQELDKMEEQGIIRPCPEVTEWVHNLVLTVKSNGDLRVCLDPRNLNKYLVRSVHHTASWEDVKHSFASGNFFSTLDAKSGYWTKMLNEDSQLLTAFNTPFKKYCFQRLPFGLSVSSEIFCEEIDRALNGIPGTFPCADDIKVQGSTEERHDINLLETIERAKKAGIKFNPDKCRIRKKKIEYFGRIVSPQGVEPSPTKVRAIHELSSPVNKQELQSFLGSVNFMATFIPNLARKTHLMRGLLKKDVNFIWTSDMEAEFEDIKKTIASSVQLTHFEPNSPAILETDASIKGLGAVLIQNGKPVQFISKSLTQAESDYSNIERELLAVLFAVEKLHVYTYGREVTVHTDHKPLESIFLKPISLAPPRLQRMLLRLRMYTLKVTYVGAKSVLLADTLSRMVRPGRDVAIPNLDVSIAQVLTIKPSRLESLREETKSDATLAKLSDLIKHGWPKAIQEIDDDLKPYWCFRDELAVLDGLVMKHQRVVVPKALRMQTLERLHDGHQGVSSTLQRARRQVYWPQMQDEISAMIDHCDKCQIHAKKKPRVPEKQISTTRPMEQIGVDIMVWKNRSALVVVDYFSGYLTVDHLVSETAESVISCLNNIFKKFGLAEQIISDNGPCFKAHKFGEYCDLLEIQHVTSSPHYHESNGRAERAIQTIKQLMKKCSTETEITMGILAYHDTPIDCNLPSPAELFFNRKINTRLGLMYQPTRLTDEQKTSLAQRRAAHLQPTNNKDQYVPNQAVWFSEDGSPDWKAGFIDSRDLNPDSYWIINNENDRRIRRNKHDLKPRVPRAEQRIEPQPNTQRMPILPEYHDPASTGQATNATECPSTISETPQPCDQQQTEPQTRVQQQNESQTLVPQQKESPPLDPSMMRTRSGRVSKPRRDSDFVYSATQV
jgi:transposase InsO family protein